MAAHCEILFCLHGVAVLATSDTDCVERTDRKQHQKKSPSAKERALSILRVSFLRGKVIHCHTVVAIQVLVRKVAAQFYGRQMDWLSTF